MVKGNRPIHIGTSGWSYDSWEGPFYPEGIVSGERLSYYAGYFNTVEVNNTFYSLPDPKTAMDWKEMVPETFLFAVKASRYITHRKKLKDPEQAIQRFFESIRPLREKMGPVLFQLPPRWHENPSRLSRFLESLPEDYRYTFEFRDPSWFTQTVYAILKKYQAAFCIYDLGERRSPEVITTDFVYVRLHGPEHKYAGSYPRQELRAWAKKIFQWLSDGKEVYLYFDNDEKGYAAQNARELLGLISSARHLENSGTSLGRLR